MKRILKTSTFCSGIGSPEFGIEELSQEEGFIHDNVFACEIDPNARKSYLANHKPTNMLLDMTSYDYKRSDIFQKEDRLYSDINISGLPCQAFSIAGRRLGENDDRGVLFFHFHRWVKNQQPKVFILENVKGLINIEKGTIFQNWLHLLGNSANGNRQMFNHPDSLGYNLHYVVLNSKDFGIPQNRERVFIVGIRADLPNDFRFPKAFPLKLRLKDLLETNVDEKYYLSDKAIKSIILNKDNIQKPNINPEIAATIQCPGNSCGTYKGANFITEITNLQGKNYINTIRTGGRGSLTTKHNWDLIIEPELTQIAQLEGFESSGRIYDSEGISCTIKANGGGGGAKTGYYAIEDNRGLIYVNGVLSRIRRLTPLETWRLQGLSDEHFYRAKNSGMSDTQLYKQAGNSMTKHVIKAIIKNTLHLLF